MNYGMVIRGFMKMACPDHQDQLSFFDKTQSADILSDAKFRDAYLLYRRVNRLPFGSRSTPSVGLQV